MEHSEDNKKAFNFSTLLELLRVRKKFLIWLITISVVLTGVYSFIIPQKFTSSASVLPPEEDGGGSGLSGFLQSISGGFSFGGLSKGLKIELYLEMLTSRTAAEYIVNKCNLEQYEDFQFENKDILYDVVRGLLFVEANRSGLMLVSTTIATPYIPNSEDKEFAANLASEISNAAVESLNFINKKKSNTKAKMKMEFITRVLQSNKKELDSIDNELEIFQKENKIIAIDEQTAAILENTVVMGIELSKAEVELGIAKNEYELGSPILNAYQKKVAGLREQYANTQQGGLIPTDNFAIAFDEVPKLIREYTNLLRDQKILTQVILYLETQKFQEAIQAESDIPTVFALDTANPPYKKSSPSRLIMVVLALFFSTTFGVLYILFNAFRKGEVYIEKKEV